MVADWDDENLYSDKNMFSIIRKKLIRCIKQTYFRKVSDNDYEQAQVGVEYISPQQHGEIYGTVYRQYFTTLLPSDLTSGDNVSRLVDYLIYFDGAGTTRNVAKGYAAYSNTASVSISLSGSSGNGNLVLGAIDWTVIDGWVDYTK